MSTISLKNPLHGAPTLVISREDKTVLIFYANECQSYSLDGNIIITHGHFYDAQEFLQFALNWVKGSTRKGA